MADNEADLEAIETGLLLDGIYQRYGHDLRAYAPTAILRRLRSRLRAEDLTTISELQARILRDPACLQRFMLGLTGSAGGLFDSAELYAGLRQHVLPLLRTFPVVRIWQVGCGSGEEAYSMAILLLEADLYHRCRIYATDIDGDKLAIAKAGTYASATAKEWEERYQRAGGQKRLADYVKTDKNQVVFDDVVRQNLIFGQHNLATDSSFNEFNLIVCRNVLSYFAPTARSRAYSLFHDSLSLFGALVLSNREGFGQNPNAASYEALKDCANVYRRIR